MFYHFKIHKESNGFWAECIELNGCITQGDTLKELKANMKEALNLYLHEPDDSKIVFPIPRKLKQTHSVQVPVDPNIAFAIKMKIIRAKKGLSQRQVADLLGMKNIYSYQRLESTRQANPSLSTIARIKAVFPEFSIDDIFVNGKQTHKRL